MAFALGLLLNGNEQTYTQDTTGGWHKVGSKITREEEKVLCGHQRPDDDHPKLGEAGLSYTIRAGSNTQIKFIAQSWLNESSFYEHVEKYIRTDVPYAWLTNAGINDVVIEGSAPNFDALINSRMQQLGASLHQVSKFHNS